jgi:hypothetical protein
MRLYTLLITFALLVSFGESEAVRCGRSGAFCGRGNRVNSRVSKSVNCCPAYHCNIGSNDAHDYCVINSG